MNKHDEKRFKRIGKELLRWRKAIIRSFEEANRNRYSESYGKKLREKIDKDRKLIKHIDPIILAISELLERDPPELEKVPRVTIRNNRGE